MTYRIHRTPTPDAVLFALSGKVDGEHVSRLQAMLVDEAKDRVVLDLSDVTLVDRAAVCFLAGAEAAGVRLVNCPEYVRSWIAAERDWQGTADTGHAP